MNELEQLEQQVLNLPPQDLAQFREWFLEFDARVWDQQIEADLKGGKLDGLISEARAEFKTGGNATSLEGHSAAADGWNERG
ncbi:hypothetical protein [Nitrospira sp. Ecomares 2.1]